MQQEINLLKNYPRAKRDLAQRLEEKTEEDRKIARQFGQEFFDGDRKVGYGGHYYSERFWKPVVPDFVEFYDLQDGATILDVGCAKGFMLYDFKQYNPTFEIRGIDISEYAIANAKAEIKDFVQVASADDLPFEDNSFDLVIAINTIHNLEKDACKKALKEMMRVSKKDAFTINDAYRNNEEKKRMNAWNLTGLTYMHTEEWKTFFQEASYTGDYYWFIP